MGKEVYSSALQPNGRDSSVKSREIIGLLKHRAHAAMKEAQIHMGFCTKSLRELAQCHIKGMPRWSLNCATFNPTSHNIDQMIEGNGRQRLNDWRARQEG
ncbi:hypothetical protein Tco_0386585 [Tanacetum coccineum]